MSIIDKPQTNKKGIKKPSYGLLMPLYEWGGRELHSFLFIAPKIEAASLPTSKRNIVTGAMIPITVPAKIAKRIFAIFLKFSQTLLISKILN